MKKNSKKDTINLFFSAFLVTAYVICSFFFSQLASSMSQGMRGFINVLIYSVFGLILFYATRVGEGKQILRFSPMTLIFLVIPAFYIILAFLVPAMPFGEQISENSLIMTVAAVALGYGLPYTFLSGYEIEKDGEEVQAEDEAKAEKSDEDSSALLQEPAEEAVKDEDAEISDDEKIDLTEAFNVEFADDGFDFENQEYFPDEEQEILGQQDMLDAENNAEEAAFCYSEDSQEDGNNEESENNENSEDLKNDEDSDEEDSQEKNEKKKKRIKRIKSKKP